MANQQEADIDTPWSLAAHGTPWAWYEPIDTGKVPATGSDVTALFTIHQELPGIVVDWFVTTLVKTPGHSPADTLASALILNQIRTPGGVAHLCAHKPNLALDVLKLNFLAYPESAGAELNRGPQYPIPFQPLKLFRG